MKGLSHVFTLVAHQEQLFSSLLVDSSQTEGVLCRWYDVLASSCIFSAHVSQLLSLTCAVSYVGLLFSHDSALSDQDAAALDAKLHIVTHFFENTKLLPILSSRWG